MRSSRKYSPIYKVKKRRESLQLVSSLILANGQKPATLLWHSYRIARSVKAIWSLYNRAERSLVLTNLVPGSLAVVF